jgi:hypothetical protein
VAPPTKDRSPELLQEPRVHPIDLARRHGALFRENAAREEEVLAVGRDERTEIRLIRVDRVAKMAELVRYSGSFSDRFPTNDEIEAIDATRDRSSHARTRR